MQKFKPSAVLPIPGLAAKIIKSDFVEDDFSLNKKGNKQAKNNLIPSIDNIEDLVSINNKKNKHKNLNAHKNIHIQSAEMDEMLDESDVYLKKKLDFQVELLKHSNLKLLV
jgi:LPS O-antigen subunit length determinant protein (WzzB/FepE family)